MAAWRRGSKRSTSPDPPKPGRKPVPAVHDSKGRLTEMLKATRTTDTFVFDSGRVLRYRGALDDQYGIGYVKDKPSRSYLLDAVEAVLAGKNPAVKATKAPG